MNAKEFFEEIQRITPARGRFRNLSQEFIDDYLAELKIFINHDNSVRFNRNSSIIDLIYYYDISNFRIQVISFSNKNDIVENENIIYFGWCEAFPLGILKKTNEIVELDWDNPNNIIGYVAKNQSFFLNALIELEKVNQKRMFSEIDDVERRKILDNFGEFAGGDKYKLFYKNF